MTRKQLKQLKTHIKNYGGATIASDGTITALKSGYMVSVAGYELKTTLKRFNLRLFKKYQKLAIMHSAYIGAWLDAGVLYLDISINIKDLKQAIKKGLDNKQLAIYDNATGDCIRL